MLSSTPPSSEARSHALASIAPTLEGGLSLLGVSGLQDELQEGVVRAVERLQRAEIKIWMLTGDRQETAVAVARASGIIHEGTSVVLLRGASLKGTRKLLAAKYDEVKQWREEGERKARQGRTAHPSAKHRLLQKRELAVVIDGAALHHVAEHAELRRLFLSIVRPPLLTLPWRLLPLLPLPWRLLLRLPSPPLITFPPPLTLSPASRPHARPPLALPRPLRCAAPRRWSRAA